VDDRTEAGVLVLGASSFVGERYVRSSVRPVTAVGRRPPTGPQPWAGPFVPVDLLDGTAVAQVIAAAPERHVVNFAGSTEVDRIERERPKDVLRPAGEAWSVNAALPATLGRACAESGRRLVTLSTDFVFDGGAGPYRAEDPPASDPRAISWYGWTKREGERLGREADPRLSIVRIAYPLRPDRYRKPDLARWIVDRARAGTLPPLYADQTISPSWVPDLVPLVDHLLDEDAGRTVHVASPDLTTPWTFGTALLDQLLPGHPAIEQGSLARTLEDPGATRRPVRGGLVASDPPETGRPWTSWRDAVDRIAAVERAR